MMTADELDLQIAWREGLSVGDATIDAEHRKLITEVNDLNASLLAQAGQDQILRLMQRLLDTAKAHFANEECLLHERGYPGREQQRLQHARLTADFEGAMNDFAVTASRLTWFVKGLSISRALMEHLAKEDMKYRDYFRSNNT